MNTSKVSKNNTRSSLPKNNTTVVCVKVANIRKNGYDNLKEWIADKNNVYIGRAGVVFIKKEDGQKERFPKKASPFANPYVIGEKKDGTRDEVIEKYEAYMRELLDDPVKGPQWKKDLLALKGKILGCWCSPEPCHGDVLVELIKEYS